MHKIFLILCAIVAIISTLAFGSTKRGGVPLKSGDIIYYLSNDKIYKIIMPNNKKAEVVFEAPKETEGERYQINALSCGPDNGLLFHLIHSPKHVTDFSKPLSRTTIVSYNLYSKELHTLVDLGEISVAFPELSPDGSKLAMSASSSKLKGVNFIVKDMISGKYVTYEKLPDSNTMVAWDPNNKEIVITGTDEKTGRVRIFFFDIQKKELKPWIEGIMPIFSPSGKLIAYTSSDQRKLIVSNREGKAIQSFRGYLFKDLNTWIGESKVIFTVGHFMYENHIGIADLEEKKIYDIKVPTSGEINGLCYKSTSGT